MQQLMSGGRRKENKMVRIDKNDLEILELDNKKKKPLKYKNQKTTIDGIKFDSKKEAKRYQELIFQQHCGIIHDLELQPSFIVQESFQYRGKTIRQIKYTADFYYRKDGEFVVEDVKGGNATKTRDYILRKKMFLKRYGHRFLFIET